MVFHTVITKKLPCIIYHYMYIFPGQIIECVVSIALCYPLARGFQNKPVSLYGAVSAIVISNEGNFFILIV